VTQPGMPASCGYGFWAGILAERRLAARLRDEIQGLAVYSRASSGMGARICGPRPPLTAATELKADAECLVAALPARAPQRGRHSD
jgi:hypothetical protein